MALLIDSYNNLEYNFHNNYTFADDIVIHQNKKTTLITERKLQYRFFLHLHPYVKELIQSLIQKGLKGLQDADTEKVNGDYKLFKEFFKDAYDPTDLVPDTEDSPHPVKDLDFTSSGAYSIYNWELFYHIPLTVAIHLSKNQRFEEAQNWLHYIFDPTDDSDESTPERFWKVKPFQTTDIQLIEDILVNLSTGTDSVLQKDTVNSIAKWKDNPFRPHVIARFRPTAYMFKAIMTYLDNLIAWGDFLFRQDSIETINEATQLYVLAVNILGTKPQAVPKKGSVRPQTYANLREDLDEFGNVLKEIEVEIPFDIMPHPKDGISNDKMVTLKSIGTSLYFCVPRNDKLIKYWDTVADRLYKIHNSLNIQGVFRQLPLFQPPIDPALLARAAAAGLDIGAAINGLNQPLPLVRFRLLIQKAIEIAQNIRSMEADLLSNVEKEDNEAIVLLRAKHQRSVLESIESARHAQWQEAKKNTESLEVSFKNMTARLKHYETLLGETDIEIPDIGSIDTGNLDDFKFNQTEPEIQAREIAYDFFAQLLDEIGIGGINFLRLNTPEALAMLFEASTIPVEVAAIAQDIIGGVLTIIPEIAGRVTPIGVGAGVAIDGKQLGQILQLTASATRGAGGIVKTMSSLSSTVGSYTRRAQDWQFQSATISGQINQMYKQITAAQIREYIAEKEWRNHQEQIQNSKDIEAFLEGEKVAQHKKTSSKGFYAYMKREARALHSKYFELAFEVAKKAERALQQELGKPTQTFLKFDYLAGKEGLYAGAKLILDLQRMEMAYHDMNIRELELIKHINIRQLDPLALHQLKTTGKCTIKLPEEIFDMGGCEGHYFRRIRSVAVSIPCIAGPYASVNCTLTLTKSTIRTSNVLLDGEYVRQDGESERFSDNYSSLSSIVTSTAQSDAGLFDPNLNGERKLPFEYAGCISEWELSLPDPTNGFPLFDYDTINDVIFHIQYTARQGGGLLQKGSIDNLNTLPEKLGTVRLFSLKHDFPTEWHRFVTTEGETKFAAKLKEEHYPFWSRNRKAEQVKIIEVTDVTPDETELDAIGNFELTFDNNEMDNVLIAIDWREEN